MAATYSVGDDTGPWDTYETYEEASRAARLRAAKGSTTVIYKTVPCARFDALVTVTESKCDGGFSWPAV